MSRWSETSLCLARLPFSPQLHLLSLYVVGCMLAAAMEAPLSNLMSGWGNRALSITRNKALVQRS